MELDCIGVADLLDDGIMISERDTIIYSNNSFNTLADVDETESALSSFKKYISRYASDSDLIDAEVATALETASPLIHRQMHLIYPSGEERWIELSLKNIDLNRTLWVFRGITRWKRAEKILRESEEKYRLLFHGGYDAVVVYSLHQSGLPLSFIEVNDVACRRLGYDREELLSRSPLDIIPPDQMGKILRTIKQLLVTDHLLFETEQIRSDGSTLAVEINAHRFQLRDQIVVLSVSRDISERKAHEEMQRKAYQQIDMNIEQFAILGDHIRNPLAVILGYAECGDEVIASKIREQNEIIRGYLDQLDRGWIESEKVREFLRRHYR
jgi:PAS domain S-box-containing protein